MSTEQVVSPSLPLPGPEQASRRQNVASNAVRAQPGPLEVRCLQSLAEIAALAEQIDALNLESRQRDPFSTSAYFRTYLRNDEFISELRGLELWFLTAFDAAGTLVGFLPLRRVRSRALGVETFTLEFMVTHDTDRPHVVARPDDERRCTDAFWRYLIDRRDDWTSIQLQQQGAGSTLWPPPAELTERGYLVRQFPNMENCTAPIRWNTLGEYFDALGKQHRKDTTRNIRKLMAAGRLRHLSSSDPEVTPLLLELYASIEARSWKAQVAGTITRHARRVAHFRELLAASQPMRVGIDLLLLDDVPIAGMMIGQFANRRYGLQTIYDVHRRDLSPGSMLMLLAFERAIADGIEAFNFLSGYAYYKTRWLAEVDTTHAVQVFRPLRPFWLKALVGDLKRRVARTAAPGTDAPARFNPLRRAVVQEGAATREPTPPPLPPEQLQRFRTLVDAIARGETRVLDHDQLAALMPFEARTPPKPGTPAPTRPSRSSPPQVQDVAPPG